MSAMFAVNKSGSVKQRVISSAHSEPIFSAADEQSDRDIFDSRRDEQQIVCISSRSPLNSLSVMEWDRPLSDILLLSYIFNSPMCRFKAAPHQKEKCL